MEQLKKQKITWGDSKPKNKIEEIKDIFRNKKTITRNFIISKQASVYCDFLIYGSKSWKEKEYWKKVKKNI